MVEDLPERNRGPRELFPMSSSFTLNDARTAYATFRSDSGAARRLELSTLSRMPRHKQAVVIGQIIRHEGVGILEKH